MPTKDDDILELLEPYRPALPLPALIHEVNKLYHASESRHYDHMHVEIRNQLPVLWRHMIERVRFDSPDAEWTILDFGCGTGFAAEQLLHHLPHDRIVHLTCFDPSPEMLERCRARLACRLPRITFVSDYRELCNLPWEYDLLATNSVLHHLHEPTATIRNLSHLLRPGCYWLAGHEPSRRFYANEHCCRTLASFLKERKWRKYLSWDYYSTRWRELMGLVPCPARAAARAAHQHGWFAKQPPVGIIGRLVDYHVPHKYQSEKPQGGFDPQTLPHALPDWQLLWLRSYAFMGRFFEGKLSPRWARACLDLARRYPLDGANFSAVWKFMPRSA